jgi:hypothetical protein
MVHRSYRVLYFALEREDSTESVYCAIRFLRPEEPENY